MTGAVGSIPVHPCTRAPVHPCTTRGGPMPQGGQGSLHRHQLTCAHPGPYSAPAPTQGACTICLPPVLCSTTRHAPSPAGPCTPCVPHALAIPRGGRRFAAPTLNQAASVGTPPTTSASRSKLPLACAAREPRPSLVRPSLPALAAGSKLCTKSLHPVMSLSSPTCACFPR